MTPQERFEWARAVAAINAERARRVDFWANLTVAAACAGVVVGYLICKLAG